MGTRVDFYVGRGTEAEWLGSYPWDGYPHGVFDKAPELFGEPLSEEHWRTWVDKFLTKNADRATRPADGWPWPWDDSATTDYAYALDGGRIYGSNFGHSWFEVDPLKDDFGQSEDETPNDAVFPKMTTDRSAPAGSRRSGVMVFGPLPRDPS